MSSLSSNGSLKSTGTVKKKLTINTTNLKSETSLGSLGTRDRMYSSKVKTIMTPQSSSSNKTVAKPKRKIATGVLAPKIATGKTIFAMNLK